MKEKFTNYSSQLASFYDADLKQRARDCEAVLATKEGRRLLVAFQEYTSIYDELAFEHIEYQAGRRNVGLGILGFCNRVARERVLQALAERNELMAERNEQLKTALEKDQKEKKNGR